MKEDATVDAINLPALLDEVRAVTAALHRGELALANQMHAASEVPALAAAGEIPSGPEAAPLRAAVEEALHLAVQIQESRRAALAAGGMSRRALGAYAHRRR